MKTSAERFSENRLSKSINNLKSFSNKRTLIPLQLVAEMQPNQNTLVRKKVLNSIIFQ